MHLMMSTNFQHDVRLLNNIYFISRHCDKFKDFRINLEKTKPPKAAAQHSGVVFGQSGMGGVSHSKLSTDHGTKLLGK